MDMEKRDTKGRAALLALFDEGTFVEMGAYVCRAGETYDALLCGYGAVEGQLTFAYAQDTDRQKGALDAVGAAKVARLYEQAVRTGAPVVAVLNSAGAVVTDGAGALSAYGKLIKCITDASGIIPQIALVEGVCGGMAAVAAGLCDFTVTVKEQSELFVLPPFNGGKNETAVSLTADTEEAAVASVRSLISLLPRNNAECADDVPTDAPDRPVAPAGLTGGALACELADAGSFVELYADAGADLTVGLCRMGGMTAGLVVGNAAADDGKLTAAGAAKAARLVSYCDAFSIPVVTLVDNAGLSSSYDPALSGALGRLATAYADATCPKVTVVTGKAYGAAFTLLGSRALGADLALALPDAVISLLDPVAAVAFLRNDAVSADNSRAALESAWKAENVAATAAAGGDIDDVVPAEELRARLCAALYMLADKSGGTPDRKHGVLPL